MSGLKFAASKTNQMRRRRTPEQIKQLLAKQASSGQSIVRFSQSKGINTGTFYAWRAKYARRNQTGSAPEGFTRLVTTASAAAGTKREPVATLHLSGGARLELTAWPLADLVRLSRELMNGEPLPHHA